MTVHFLVTVATTWIALCLLGDLLARWFLHRQHRTVPGPISLSGFLLLPILIVSSVLFAIVATSVEARRRRARVRAELLEMRHEATDIRARLDGLTGPDADEARQFLTQMIAEMDRRLKRVS